MEHDVIGVTGVLVICTEITYLFRSIEGPNEKYELEKLKKEREQLLEVNFPMSFIL